VTGTFTLTGRLLHHDDVTPYPDSPIELISTLHSDTTADVTFVGGAAGITDADGSFSMVLVTFAGLNYTLVSAASPPLFDPVSFAAPSAGATLDFSDLLADTAGITPDLVVEILAARDDAVAAAAAAAAIGTTNDTLIAGRLADGTSATRAALDNAQQTVNVRTHGAIGNGVANDTTALQAALDYADGLTGGGTVWVPDGTYKITGSLILGSHTTLLMASGAVIRAGSTIAGAMIKTSLTVPISDRLCMAGGILDCNSFADTGLQLSYFVHVTVRDVVVENYKLNGFLIGVTAATAPSFEAKLYNLKTWRPSTSATPATSRGIAFDNASDCHVYGAIVNGAHLSVTTDFGGHTFVGVHAWNFDASGRPDTCFYDNGGNNTYVDCYADGPDTIGWAFTKDGCAIIGGLALRSTASTDNAGSVVANSSAGNVPTRILVMGLRVDADPAHRWATDFLNNDTLVSLYGVMCRNVVTTHGDQIFQDLAVRSVSAATTQKKSDQVIIVTDSTAVTVTLLDPWTLPAGRLIRIVNNSTATVTVTNTSGGGLGTGVPTTIATHTTGRYLADGASLWFAA
jgi:hypothetical protein